MKKKIFNYFSTVSKQLTRFETKRTKVVVQETSQVSQMSYLVLKNMCVR